MTACKKRNSYSINRWLHVLRGPLHSACTLLLIVSVVLSSLSIASSPRALAAGTTTNVSLNLSSTKPSVAGSNVVTSGSVLIRVGTSTMTVTSNSVLTPAEYMAAVQVANTGRQTLNLSSLGNAVSGTVITSAATQKITDITVPSGVVAIDNFAAGKLNLTGDFINSGTFFAISDSRAVTTASITANNIINQNGALLTSILPAGGLSGFSNLLSNVGLSLTALTSIINHGTISSAAALDMTAGTSIVNTGIAGGSASMQAATSLSMSAPSITNSGQITAMLNDANLITNNLQNSGIIKSAQGAMSIESLSGNLLNVLNDQGLLSAKGALSLSLGPNSADDRLNLSGGTLEASNLILDAKLGNVIASMVDAPNQIDIQAANYSLSVSNGTHGLTLSHIPALHSASLSYAGLGDVIFHGFSTLGSNVDVNTSGAISVLGPGNSKAPGDIDTSAASGNAGYVKLVSGQGISVGNISTTGTGTGNGGDITLYAGTTVASGNLDASAGANGGKAGVITIYAGSGNVNAITTGSITDTSANGAAGAVSITTPGGAQINGDLNAPGAAVTLATGTLDITGAIHVEGGSVDLEQEHDGQYLVSFTDLAKWAGSDVKVGSLNGYSADIILNSDCIDCLSNLNSLVFQTSGHYIGTGHIIQLPATADFSVVANAGINTGSVTGARTIGFQTQGNLLVDGNVHAANAVDLSAGALTVASNQSIKSDAGHVLLNSTGDISVGASNLSADGGVVLLNAGGNIVIGNGASFSSTAHTNPDGSVTGGQIAVNAGSSQTDLSVILSDLQSSRVEGSEILSVIGGAFDSSNVVNSSGSSLMKVVFPTGSGKTITNSVFNLSGGVLYIDPPDGNNVTINGATFSVSGSAAPVTNGGGGNGNGGGGNGNGGGNNGGGGNTGGTGNGSGTSGSGGGFTFGNDITNAATTFATADGSLDVSAGSLFNTAPSIMTGRDDLGELGSDNAAAVLPSDVSGNGDGSLLPVWREAIFCAPQGLLKEQAQIDKDSWIIAANKCQPFSFEHADGSIIIGTGPAIFAPAANRTLLLKEGKLLVIAGQNNIVVRTPMCNITVPVNSAATVEFDPVGLARLTALAGGKASISLTRQGETMILSAAAGEQLVLAHSSIADNQISCQPPVTNRKLDTWLVHIDTIRGQKFVFDRGEMVAQEGLLNCTLSCFTKLQQAMIDQIRKSMLFDQPKELKSLLPVKPLVVATGIQSKVKRSVRQTAKADHLQPVSFGPSNDLAVPEITTFTSQTATVKYQPGTTIGIVKPGVLRLAHGEAIVSTQSATTVYAGDYTVQIDAGTVAFIAARNEHVVVRNLYESKRGAISVTTPDRKCVGAQLGHEIIIGHAGLSFTRALGQDPVGRRRLGHLDLGMASNVITCEVSLVSLLQNTDLLSQLSRSGAAEDIALIRRIEKMAVALSLITQSHGNYSIVSH